MVRVILHLIIFILISCNINKKVRLDDFTIRPCSDAGSYQLIDTNNFYLLYERSAEDYFMNSKLDTVKLKDLNSYIKFFKNGRVAIYINFFDEKLKSSSAGVYNFCGQNRVMEFNYYHVQSGNFLSKSTVEIKGDTLIVRTLPSPQTKGDISKYIKIKMLIKPIISTPNW